MFFPGSYCNSIKMLDPLTLFTTQTVNKVRSLEVTQEAQMLTQCIRCCWMSYVTLQRHLESHLDRLSSYCLTQSGI